jgi:serine protease AprX
MKSTTEANCFSALWGRRTMALVLILLASSLAFAAKGNSAHAKMNHGQQKKATEFAKMAQRTPVDVIIQYSAPPTSANLAKVRARGGRARRQFNSIRGHLYSLTPDQIDKIIADDSSIFYISPNRAVTSTVDYGATTAGAEIARQIYGYTGKGVTVAVIDSGIAPVADLNDANGTSRVIFSQDFTGTGDGDGFGHGTHIAGIIGGTGADSSCANCTHTITGVAPGVSFVNFRVLDNNGAGTDASVIAAIEAAIANKDKFNIRVINLSVGRGVFESYKLDPLTQAVERAWQAGIVVVVAAGNNGRDNSHDNHGYGMITAPGNDPYVITVGAMKTQNNPDPTDDTPATYSSKGPSIVDMVVKPDLVAPGNQIISLLAPNSTLSTQYPTNIVPLRIYQDTTSTENSTSYFAMSGTSMATPMVVGAAALLLEKAPDLTPDQVKAILMKSARKLPQAVSKTVDPVTGETFYTENDIFTVGAGYLDIAAALQLADVPAAGFGIAKSPVVVMNADNTVTLTPEAGTLWATSTWKGQATWGSNVLATDAAAVDSVLWGTGVATADSVLWGTNVAQVDSVLWGTGVASGTVDSVLWGTNTIQSVLWGTSFADSVLWGTATVDSVLWGTNVAQVDSVLWGTSSITGTVDSVLWGTSSMMAEAAKCAMYGEM